jgi:hypothetical protein
MEQPDFPSNSDISKRNIPEKDLSRVTTHDPVRKRRSLRKQFVETFFAGDMKSAIRYAVMDVLLLSARDMLADSASGIIDKLLYGDSRRRGYTNPQYQRYGHVDYRSVSSGPPGHRMPSSQRALSRQARARHDFDEIVLDSRTEAEQVIDQMYEVINRYGSITVADLYELVGISSAHTDNKWGWTDLSGAGVSRLRDGYLLDLPDPAPLD